MSDETYKRLCENWVATFKEWTLPRSQAIEPLLEWTAIWTLATSLRRRVWIPKSILGSWTCYPYLYTMIVGPSGMGKTTTIRYAYDLLSQMDGFPKPPNIVTPEGLIDEMLKSPDASSYLVIEEFGDLFLKDKTGTFFGLLTSFFDGKADIRQKTLMRQTEYALKPCLNVFAGTTPEWIADNISLNTLNGGFGSRFLWLYVNKLRQRRMYYVDEYASTNFQQLEQNLLADLIHISTKLEGEFNIDKDTLKWMEEWYQNMSEGSNKNLSGYLKRKPEFVHKIAMLMHVAYSDTMVLNTLDFQNAINLVESLEGTLPRIFEGVGKNIYSLDMRDIAAAVVENPGIGEANLRDIFKNAAEPNKLTELIDGLLQAGILKSEMNENNKRQFYLKED